MKPLLNHLIHDSYPYVDVTFFETLVVESVKYKYMKLMPDQIIFCLNGYVQIEHT